MSLVSDRLCDRRLPLYSRRDALRHSACGFGWLALCDLASRARASEATSDGVSRVPVTHFPASAKRVIFLCMRGGPSHVDTFDYKPELAKHDGEPGRRNGTRLLASPWEFRQRGESGLWMSDLFPHLAEHADRLCLIRSMQTDVPAHPQAFRQLHTGSSRFIRPSLGAWSLYGLGSDNEELPGFVTITPPSGFGGAQNYGAGFLPAIHQGTRFGSDNRPIRSATIPHLSGSQAAGEQRLSLDLAQSFNRAQRDAGGGHDREFDGLIESLELGFRMQSTLPDLLDLQNESDATLDLYGIDGGPTDDFGRKCLLARRMVEEGVRFVEITHGNWDQHFNLQAALENNVRAIDRPIAGLLTDLASRGLLDETLVIWSGEFGRTPHAQGRDGRDHNNEAFTCWMAGGGTRGGYAHGESDEFGYRAAVDPVSIHDFHATILRLLGLDHTRLTFRHAGRDFRLTDVYGNVIESILNSSGPNVTTS
ncbi:MAG: DUF1501 domain-containing protein [Planctomycetaceae bacterium]|nr:MAG: DUF1501 domain-containing protein [Planctomycetaceae bacterium]